MNDSEQDKELAEYLAELEHGSVVFDELCKELDAIDLAEAEITEKIDHAEKLLDQGSEESFAAALNTLRSIFEGVDMQALVKEAGIDLDSL